MSARLDHYSNTYANAVALVNAKGAVRAGDVAKELGISADHARVTLGRAVRRGDAVKPERGLYFSPLDQPVPVNHDHTVCKPDEPKSNLCPVCGKTTWAVLVTATHEVPISCVQCGYVWGWA